MINAITYLKELFLKSEDLASKSQLDSGKTPSIVFYTALAHFMNDADHDEDLSKIGGGLAEQAAERNISAANTGWIATPSACETHYKQIRTLLEKGLTDFRSSGMGDDGVKGSKTHKQVVTIYSSEFWDFCCGNFKVSYPLSLPTSTLMTHTPSRFCTCTQF